MGNVQTKEDLTRLSFYGYRVSNRFCKVQELGENEMRKILLTLLALSVVVCFLWNLSYAEEREKPHSLLYVQQIYYENGYWDNLEALIGPPDGEYAYSRNPSYTVPTAILDFGKVVFSELISIYHYDPHAEETSLDIYISLNASGPYEYLGEVDGTGVNELEFDGRTFRYIKIVQSQTYPGQEDGIDAIGVAEESFREIPMPFQDDFEAYPVGQAPPAPWTTLDFSSVVSSEVSHSGTKSVKVWGGPYVSRSAVIDLGRNYPNHLRLEAYVFLSGTDSRGWIGFFEQIYNMAPQFNCVYFGDEHKIYFVSGDTNYPTNELLSGSWTPGVWHQVRIDYDYSNLRANVYLDAELIGQDIPMSPKEATWEYQGIHYFNLSKVGVLHGEGNSIYVDDFSITEVTQHGLKPPTLISPQNGTVLDNGCKDHSDSIEWDFDWSDVPGATKYHIYVILENAVNPVIDAITTASSYHYSSLGAYIEDAHRFNWTWKVRAGNDSGEWSEWSEVRYFDVEPLDTDCQVQYFIPDIKVNGSDGPITLSQSDTLSITVALNNNGQTDNADWWLAADTPFGLYFFTFDGWTDAWVPGYQGPLFYLDSFEVLNMPVSGLPAGTYTLYFGVDTVMDGNVTWDGVYYDTVVVELVASVHIEAYQLNRIPAITSLPEASTIPLKFPEPISDVGKFGAIVRVFNPTSEIFNGALEVKQFVSPSGSETFYQTGWGAGHVNIYDISPGTYKDIFVELVPPHPPFSGYETGKWQATIALETAGGIWAEILDTISVEFEIKPFGQLTYTCSSEKPLWQQLGKLVASPGALSNEQLHYEEVIAETCAAAQVIASIISHPIADAIAKAICEPFMPVIDFFNLERDIVGDIVKTTILLLGPSLDASSGTLSFTWMTKSSFFYKISFHYDRAVITLSLPDTVKIIDGDGGYVYHDRENSRNRVLWVINGIDKQIYPLSNNFEWQHHAINLKIDDSEVRNYDLELTISLQIGPFQGVGGDSYDKLSDCPMIYNYEKWCLTPEEMCWYEISSKKFNMVINK